MDLSMHYRTAARLTLALACWIYGASAEAQAPPQEHYGSVRYLSGGVGREEARPMERLAGAYNVKVTFVEGSRAYLSNVRLIVREQSGKTRLWLKNAGPVVYARLPAGSYSIAAEHGKRIYIQRVTVPTKGQRSVLMKWPVDIGHH
jgi:hypothetical protein